MTPEAEIVLQVISTYGVWHRDGIRLRKLIEFSRLQGEVVCKAITELIRDGAAELVPIREPGSIFDREFGLSRTTKGERILPAPGAET